MKILVNKGRNNSSSSYLNYYAVEENIHIMDNHLGAISPLYEFGNTFDEIIFYHIDRHYDLGGLNEYHYEYILNKKSIPNIKDLDSEKSLSGCNIFLWDNYIHLFYEKYHRKIKETYFITHQTTQFNYKWRIFNELTIFGLIKHHLIEKNVILNIDIDFFFFENNKGEIYEAFSDILITEFSKWFTNNKKKFKLVIIALSPECCGGWTQANKMFKKIFPNLALNI